MEIMQPQQRLIQGASRHLHRSLSKRSGIRNTATTAFFRSP